MDYTLDKNTSTLITKLEAAEKQVINIICTRGSLSLQREAVAGIAEARRIALLINYKNKAG
jgi:hypothetical protein